VKPRKKQMKHKHAELIKAWADGAEIEFQNPGIKCIWHDDETPHWHELLVYRIKPTPKPDSVAHFYANVGAVGRVVDLTKADLRLIFDGETGTLKSAEVI
jgi:hypothetical protein